MNHGSRCDRKPLLTSVYPRYHILLIEYASNAGLLNMRRTPGQRSQSGFVRTLIERSLNGQTGRDDEMAAARPQFHLRASADQFPIVWISDSVFRCLTELRIVPDEPEKGVRIQ